MVLGNVEETITTTEIEQDNEVTKLTKRKIEMLFVRGDTVILVSPPAKV
eukprot:CAMPEP_0201552650 /NCGR_PEP_ID=MMETSP0173_2-20130828/16837_1 /ASSEMBLY_ACC=CAM_ASM_000268 /TAXON_ID=218659 /ORGANISM="Vexillifera sp., Strain DIVA3 564/2" /LENGTH=48 /DNA_ID= /DNA_START= /DNA_END= /DNA_ORIENTATION=